MAAPGVAIAGDIGQYLPMTQMTPVLVRMPAGLLAAIDALRGDVPRAVWIRRCCERVATPPTTVWGGYGGTPNAAVARPMKPGETVSLQLGPVERKPGSMLKKGKT